MKAVVYKKKGEVRLEDVPEPRIAYPTDAIIKVTGAAICASDLHIKNEVPWPAGKIMGHEYCGEVAAVGSQVSYLKKGDRVAGRPVAYCGDCYYCRRGQHALCVRAGIDGGPDGSGALGVQAEYARIPFADNTLDKIPDGLAYEDVIFVGDILSTGFSGLLNTRVGFSDSVAVFGCGPVGLCTVACAPLFGAGLVVAVDLLDYRLDIARRFGAVAINSSREDPLPRIKELTGGIGVDAAIETAGAEASLRQTLKVARRGGRVSILGTVHKPFLFDLQERFFDMFNLNIGLGDQNYVPELMRLIRQGRLDLKPLITHTLPLAQAMRGYEIFEKKLENCIKVILKP